MVFKQQSVKRTGFRSRRVFLAFGALLLLTPLLLAAFSMFSTPEPKISGMPLSDWLKDGDWGNANEDLARIGPKAIPLLMERVDSRKSVWQSIYRNTHSHLPRWIRRKLPPPHPTQWVRDKALRALGEFGPEAGQALPIILNNLTNSQRVFEPMRASLRIVETFMNIGPAAKQALPSLRKLIHHNDATVRALAAAAIVKITGRPENSIPVLTDCLTASRHSASAKRHCGWSSPAIRYGLDPDSHAFKSRMTAAWLLGELAPHSKPALPILKQVLKNTHNGFLSPLVARAIWKLEKDPNLVLPVLKTSLRSDTNDVRVMACAALGEMGKPAASALPDLRAACQKSLHTRRLALKAISRISMQ